MHLGTLAAKEQTAREKVLEASQKLASRLNLDTSVIDQLKRTNRDPRVNGLFQLEAVVELLNLVNATLEAEPVKPTKKGK